MVTTDMLTANPDVSGIFGMNDPSALGAVLAVEQAGKAGAINVTGVDGSPEAVEELKRGGSPLSAPRRKTREKWFAVPYRLLRIWSTVSRSPPVPF